MERIESQGADQAELAHEVIAWIVHARRRLTTMELQEALGVEIGEDEFDSDNCPDIDYVVSVCAGLVTIDHGTNVIRLVHYTAQEYFEKNQQKWFPGAEAKIANVCITYLSYTVPGANLHPQPQRHDQTSLLWCRSKAYPTTPQFYNYAALNWGHHAGEAPTTFAGIMQFLRQPKKIETAWRAIARSISVWSSFGIYHLTRGSGLHLTAYFGLEAATSMLIRETSSPELLRTQHATPIMIAVLQGHKAIVKLLLDRNVAVNPSPYGLTPLFLAAHLGHQTMVQLLLDRRPTIVENLGKYDPLDVAYKSPHTHVVKLLLEYYSSSSIGLNMYLRVLNFGMKLGYDVVIDTLLSKNDPPNFESMDPHLGELLFEATRCGNSKTVQFLLDSYMPTYTDVHSSSIWYTDVLQLALEGGQGVIVKILLAFYADHQKRTGRGLANTAYLTTMDGKSLLFKMVEKERRQPVRALLEAGVDPNYIDTSGRTPLHAACLHYSFGYTTILQLLIDAGAELDKRDNFGRTPLHIACIFRGYCCETIVQFMLHAGANINAQDDFGKSALHVACLNKHIDLVKLLLDNGADVHCADVYGNTPLHLACQWDGDAIARLLLGAGAVVECQNKVGDSPLHYAFSGGHEAVVKILLDAGADVGCLNSGGETPLDHSRRRGHTAAVSLLLGYGVNKSQTPWPTDPEWPIDPLETIRKAGLRLKPHDFSRTPERGCRS
jgi:ankyrin repeat protein